MRRIVLLTAMAFMAGLFATGMALGMSHEKMGGMGTGMTEKHGTAEMMGTEGYATYELNRAQVRELQSILRDGGYNVGAVDGIIGPNTRGAIESFQRDKGLAATGVPDEKTLRALAPSTEKQEFFGLSPEFGEGKGGMWEEKEKMEGEPMKGSPSSY